MVQTKKSWFRPMHGVILLLVGGFASVLAVPVTTVNEHTNSEYDTLVKKMNAARDAQTPADKQRAKESVDAFMKAYKVFMSPRCMNCHPSGDIPLQGDDSHLHPMGVVRGEDGKGVSAMKCKNCHQDANVAGEHMPPGSPGWSLPPAHLKMVFQGKSPRQLALHFKDNSFTGFKDFKKDMVHHVETEPLVLHSWTYGTPPPYTHAEFVAAVKEWIAKGASVPAK